MLTDEAIVHACCQEQARVMRVPLETPNASAGANLRALFNLLGHPPPGVYYADKKCSAGHSAGGRASAIVTGAASLRVSHNLTHSS